MFTTIKEATHYIENRRVRHRFEYFKSVLDKHHIPYASLKCIHVTGTNGKGGTVNFISHILREAGMKVGTFTSPYIICHQDRFTINGKMMEEDDFIRLVNHFYPIIEKYHLSMFEADVLIMFQYFYEQQIDIAIIEVGIGGRNDKTNMVLPMASIITNVGSDHLSQIGPTLKDVAYEKAGIIKQDVPVFVGEMDEELLTVIQKEAKEKNALCTVVHLCFNEPFNYKNVNNIHLSMEGVYHKINACMAIEVVTSLFKDINEEIIRRGLEKATWPGRFECFALNDAMLYLDGAHNMHAMEALMTSVKALNQEVTFIYAALSDKDYQEMAAYISNCGYPLEVCQFEDDRALNFSQANSIHATNFYASIDEAIENIKNQHKTYIVCGSLHFISQFRNKIIQKKTYL